MHRWLFLFLCFAQVAVLAEEEEEIWHEEEVVERPSLYDRQRDEQLDEQMQQRIAEEVGKSKQKEKKKERCVGGECELESEF